MDSRKVTLFLMTIKGLDVLKRIVGQYGAHVVDLVVYGMDRAVIKDYSEEIKAFSEKHFIRVKSRKEPYKVKTKYALAISWRWLIDVSDSFELITIHDSLLPKYRGFSPLVNQLVNGEATLGVTALMSSDEYDRGNILRQKKVDINYPIKIQEAIDRIVGLYVEIAIELLRDIRNQESLKGYPQNEEVATYSLWRDEQDYQIEWEKNAEYIQRFIHALGFPYKGAKTHIRGKEVRVFDADIFPDVKIENRDLGKVIFMKEGFPIVVCGEGLLCLKKAIYADTKESIFPLRQFRVRFQ